MSDTAEDIVRALAALDDESRIYDFIVCTFCGVSQSVSDPDDLALNEPHEVGCLWSRAVEWVAERDWWPVPGETVECVDNDDFGFFGRGERYVVKANDDGRLTFEGTPAYWFVTHFRRVKDQPRRVQSKDWGTGEVLADHDGVLTVQFPGLDNPVDVPADTMTEVQA